MERPEMKEEAHHDPRYLSTLLQVARQGLRALRRQTDLPGLSATGPTVSFRVSCRTCGDGLIAGDAMTLWDAGDTGFAVYSHCGITQRTGSLTRHTLDLMITLGATTHPSSRPRLTFDDYLTLKDALEATDTPQEELC